MKHSTEVADLAAWLNEQLDEDELGARMAGEVCVAWLTYRDGASWLCDPARVLAEVEAKRAILRVHNTWDAYPADVHQPERLARQPEWLPGPGFLRSYARACIGCGADPGGEYYVCEDVNDCPVLRALALPYRDRPGYRPEWAPET